MLCEWVGKTWQQDSLFALLSIAYLIPYIFVTGALLVAALGLGGVSTMLL